MIRFLLGLAALQTLLIYVPPLVWPMWIAHFVAIESCFLGVVLGTAAASLAPDPWTRAIAGALALACAWPGLAVAPGYLREGVAFSPARWLGLPGPKVAVERDVRLGHSVADVYRPVGDGPLPWIAVVHGGSWRSGDKGDAEAVSHELANAGYLVVDLRYRLAPEFPFPAGISDVYCALAEIQARATEWNIDPDRGALLGRSAGAQIALTTAYLAANPVGLAAVGGISPPAACTVRPLRAVISIYGPVDLAWAHDHPYVPDVVDGTNAIEQYLGGAPEQIPSVYTAANPISWVTEGADSFPSTLLIHGLAERCVRPRNPEVLQAALQKHGRSVQSLLIPMADHGFDIRPGGLGEQLSRGVILDFLRETLRQ